MEIWVRKNAWGSGLGFEGGGGEGVARDVEGPHVRKINYG